MSGQSSPTENIPPQDEEEDRESIQHGRDSDSDADDGSSNGNKNSKNRSENDDTENGLSYNYTLEADVQKLKTLANSTNFHVKVSEEKLETIKERTEVQKKQNSIMEKQMDNVTEELKKLSAGQKLLQEELAAQKLKTEELTRLTAEVKYLSLQMNRFLGTQNANNGSGPSQLMNPMQQPLLTFAQTAAVSTTSPTGPQKPLKPTPPENTAPQQQSPPLAQAAYTGPNNNGSGYSGSNNNGSGHFIWSVYKIYPNGTVVIRNTRPDGRTDGVIHTDYSWLKSEIGCEKLTAQKDRLHYLFKSGDRLTDVTLELDGSVRHARTWCVKDSTAPNRWQNGTEFAIIPARLGKMETDDTLMITLGPERSPLKSVQRLGAHIDTDVFAQLTHGTEINAWARIVRDGPKYMLDGLTM